MEVFDPIFTLELLSFYNLGRTVYRTFNQTVSVSVVTRTHLLIFVAVEAGVYLAVV
jgi:hypothetical protein